MSWCTRFCKGEVKFWQAFWLPLVAIVATVIGYAFYVSHLLASGQVAVSQFADYQFYLHVVLLLLSLLWVSKLARAFGNASLKWSAWLAVLVAVFLIFISTFNVTYRLYHAHDVPLQNDFDGDEGV